MMMIAVGIPVKSSLMITVCFRVKWPIVITMGEVIHNYYNGMKWSIIIIVSSRVMWSIMITLDFCMKRSVMITLDFCVKWSVMITVGYFRLSGLS